MSALGPNERRLLQALRAMDEPSESDRARVRARVLGAAAAAGATASLAAAKASAAGTGAAGTASVAPPAAVGAAVASGSWKIASAVALLIGGAGGAAWLAATSVDTAGFNADAPSGVAPPAPSARSTSGPSAATAEPALPAVASATESALPGAASAAPTASVAVPKPQPQKPTPTPAPQRAVQPVRAMDLERELSLLEQAQQALKRGDPTSALQSLNQHAAAHPGGVLARERAGIRAVALCESGKEAEGQRAARQFLAQHPKSPMAARVRAACLTRRK